MWNVKFYLNVRFNFKGTEDVTFRFNSSQFDLGKFH